MPAEQEGQAQWEERGYGESLLEGSSQHHGGLAMHSPMAQPVLTQDLALCWLLAPGIRLPLASPSPADDAGLQQSKEQSYLHLTQPDPVGWREER